MVYKLHDSPPLPVSRCWRFWILVPLRVTLVYLLLYRCLLCSGRCLGWKDSLNIERNKPWRHYLDTIEMRRRPAMPNNNKLESAHAVGSPGGIVYVAVVYRQQRWFLNPTGALNAFVQRQYESLSLQRCLIPSKTLLLISNPEETCPPPMQPARPFPWCVSRACLRRLRDPKKNHSHDVSYRIGTRPGTNSCAHVEDRLWLTHENVKLDDNKTVAVAVVQSTGMAFLG